MKQLFGTTLAIAFAAVGWTAPADAQSLNNLRYKAALTAALDYAVDQTLINYCLRAPGERGPYLYIWAHDNLQQGIESLKSAGGNPAQVEGLAKLVMTNVRFFAPDAKDVALEPQCSARKVEKNVALLTGLSLPLHMRPPFKNFVRQAEVVPNLQ